jgi:peptidyl-prolyl cis-trans isomerase D
LQQQNPQYAENPMIVGMFEQRIGQQMVQQQILLAEAEKLGIQATNDDVIQFLHKGQFGEYLFPNGQFIGTDRYTAFIANQFNLSIAEFEDEVKQDIVIRRSAGAGHRRGYGGRPGGPRDLSQRQHQDQVRLCGDRGRRPAQDDQSLGRRVWRASSRRMPRATPRPCRKSARSPTLPLLPMSCPAGSAAQPAGDSAVLYAHQAEYSVPEQARSRHILIKVAPGADAKTDAAAKAKAEGLLKQIQGGANFADLAKKNSDDPGSKDSGGELGFAKRGRMVPEFDECAIFTQKIGDTKIVKSQFGYHIIQVEERQTAHSQPLNEVLPTIQATLIRQKAAQAEEATRGR